MQRTVTLCAILHDVDDWKYRENDHAAQSRAKAFLIEQGADEALLKTVEFVLKHIGFKESLGSPGSAGRPTGTKTEELVLSVVQDADRLDALGTPFTLLCSRTQVHLHYRCMQ